MTAVGHVAPSSSRDRRRSRHHALSIAGTAALTLIIAGLGPVAAHAGLAATHTPTMRVSVGYADNERATPNLPAPWYGSPNTLFEGDTTSGKWDGGAIKVDNLGSHTLKLSGITVILHSDNNGVPYRHQTFNLWHPSNNRYFAIPAGDSIIFADTHRYFDGTYWTTDFDTSDYPLTKQCAPVSSTLAPPRVILTFENGKKKVLADTAHVLDTRGYDPANACHDQNESLPWQAVGALGVASTSQHLRLSLGGSQTTNDRHINHYALVEATLTDPTSNPLANVKVTFRVTSGPDAGRHFDVITNNNGRATWYVEGLYPGTDVFAARVKNASGGYIHSFNTVTVHWVS